MAAMPSGERKEFEKAFFTEYWNFRRANYEPEDNDAFWQMLFQKTNEFGDKINHDWYAEELLMICVMDIENRFHKREKNHSDFWLSLVNKMRKKEGKPLLKEPQNEGKRA